MMQKQLFIIKVLLLLAGTSIFGQCPDKNYLYKRLVFIGDSALKYSDSQLNELLAYESVMKDCAYRSDSTHDKLIRTIILIYMSRADFLKTVEYLKKSINLISANPLSQSLKQKQLITNYYYLSATYDSLHNMAEGIKAANNAIDIARKLNATNEIGCIRAIYKRLIYLFDIGDFNRCAEDAIVCEKLSREYASLHVQDSWAYSTGKYLASSSLGWYIEAVLSMNKYDLAESLLADKELQFKKAGLQNYLGGIYEGLARVELNKNNCQLALEYLNKALASEKKAGNYFNYKQLLITTGHEVYFTHCPDTDKALACYRKALLHSGSDKSRTEQDAMESLKVIGYMANIYVQKGLYKKAFESFQLAFNQVKPGCNESIIANTSRQEIIKMKKLHYLANLIIDKGDAFMASYHSTKTLQDLKQAISVYNMADRFLNKIKEEQSDVLSKLFWRSGTRRLYEHAVEACYLSGDSRGAFSFFEKSRSILLYDQLNKLYMMTNGDISRQEQLKKNLLANERMKNEQQAGSKEYGELVAQHFSITGQLDSLEALIKVNHPFYYQRDIDTSFLSVKEAVDKLLRDHSGLVEVFSGATSVYSLIITSQKTFFYRIDKPDYENTVKLYLTYISNPDLLNSHWNEFISVAAHLYGLVFQNATLPPGRIIISPDGSYFPFESLVTGKNGSQPVYFLKEHAVSYTYSARYLLSDFVNPGPVRPGNFMGLAPVNYAYSQKLTSLNGSNTSLDKIVRYFNKSSSFDGESATRNNFLRQFSDYKIIQLYAHASDSSDRKEPVIYFVDSALYLSEIIPEKKPGTQLIVLSACESGNGINYQGEGVFSFNRAFAAIGIPSSVANLWSIDNVSTYRLTELFYKYLANGLPLDVSLQKAKLEFMQTAAGENQLPYYWAAPVLVGKTEAIVLNKPSAWKYIVAGICVLLAVFIFFKKRNDDTNR